MTLSLKSVSLKNVWTHKAFTAVLIHHMFYLSIDCIYLYLLYYPFILHHMFIYYSMFNNPFSFCSNAYSRAATVIPSCRAKTSFLQSPVVWHRATAQNTLFLCILFTYFQYFGLRHVHWCMLSFVSLPFSSLQIEHIRAVPVPHRLILQYPRSGCAQFPENSLFLKDLVAGHCLTDDLLANAEGKEVWALLKNDLASSLTSFSLWAVMLTPKLCVSTCEESHPFIPSYFFVSSRFRFSLFKATLTHPVKSLVDLLLVLSQSVFKSLTGSGLQEWSWMKSLLDKNNMRTVKVEYLFRVSYWRRPRDSASWFTWSVRQEAAGVELQLLHEADLAVVTQTVEVPLPQNKDGGGGVGEGGHTEVQGLFSQDKRPVGLEDGHTHTHSYRIGPTLNTV